MGVDYNFNVIVGVKVGDLLVDNLADRNEWYNGSYSVKNFPDVFTEDLVFNITNFLTDVTDEMVCEGSSSYWSSADIKDHVLGREIFSHATDSSSRNGGSMDMEEVAKVKADVEEKIESVFGVKLNAEIHFITSCLG